jgi:vitamin B12 transporter
MFRLSHRFTFAYVCIFVLVGIAYTLPNTSIHGTVTDPSGATVANAKVELLETKNDHGIPLATVMTDANGQYVLERASAAASRLRVSSPGFRTVEQSISIEADSHEMLLNVSLPLASFSEQITVTSTGTPTPQSQLGAAVTTLSQPDYEGTRDIYEGLRFVPGVQAVQTGQAGGTTALFIRGGGAGGSVDGNATKLMIDGIPANDIGGGVEFANFASAAIAEVEVLRGPNSVLYGSDALAGVISLTTPRGTTPLPLLTYMIDGGNFGTYHQEGTFSGLYNRLDYFSDFSRFDTSNSVPEDTFHNGTFAGSYGLKLSENSSLRATVHHDQVASGQPSAIDLYGIPTLAKQANEDSYFGATWEDQTTPNWHNLVGYGGIRLRSNYTQFAASGIPQYIDGTLVDYLGAPVTLHGANGYTVSGQAVYQYVETYPNSYPTSSDKDFVYAQSDYRVNPHLLGLFAFRYEDERGYSAAPTSSIERANYSYTLELQGDIHNRLFYTIGGGLEDNGLFGFAGTPRVSLAWQAARGNANRFFDGTKLRASFGEGIKEPSVSDQTTSLYALLESLPGGNGLIAVSRQHHRARSLPQLRWRRRPDAFQRPRTRESHALPQRIH